MTGLRARGRRLAAGPAFVPGAGAAFGALSLGGALATPAGRLVAVRIFEFAGELAAQLAAVAVAVPPL